jgi:hypothetical protein
MADTWSSYFINMRAACIVARGSAGAGSDGQALPALLPLDSFLLMSTLASALASAIARTSWIQEKGANLTLPDVVAEDNAIDPLPFLAGLGADGHPTLRTVGLSSYVVVGKGNTDPATFDFVIQALDDWDRLVTVSATSIKSHGGAPDIAIPSSDVDSIFAAALALCADVDVLGENPPVKTWDQIKAATAYALDETRVKIKALAIDASELAGKAAAEAGDLAGRAAGAAASGFFGQATAVTLAVAAIAIWLVIK